MNLSTVIFIYLFFNLIMNGSMLTICHST